MYIIYGIHIFLFIDWLKTIALNKVTNRWRNHNNKTTRGGGRKRLPKFKFSAKFPIGLHVILQNTDKKIRKRLLYCVKNYFNRKSVEVQR